MARSQPQRPERQTLSVVLLGSFNPRIFHPIWLEREGLARPGELDESLSEKQKEPLLVTPEVSRCQIGEEISLECLTNRLTLNAATVLSEERLRSLATEIVAKLPHTPITALGINHILVYRARNEAEWHAIGDMLVPKDQIWQPVMEGRPGMAVVRVEEHRPGPPPVRIWATVQPVRDPAAPCRFQVNINWHHDLPESAPGDASKAELIQEFINSQWEPARDFGPMLANSILDAVRQTSQ